VLTYNVTIAVLSVLIFLVLSGSILHYYTSDNRLMRSSEPTIGFTDSNIEKLHTGLSKKEVKKLFGVPNQVYIHTEEKFTGFIKDTIKIEKWTYLKSPSRNTIYFKNGKVYKFDVYVWSQE